MSSGQCVSQPRACVHPSLSSERAMSSPSESAAIIVSTVECLRYCLVQHTGEEQEQKRLQSMLITDQVRTHSSHGLNTTGTAETNDLSVEVDVSLMFLVPV